jgi:hypothetical protein
MASVADNFHILIFFCKSAQPNETKFIRDGPWEEDIKICSYEVDLLEEWLVEGPKERKSEKILYQVSDTCSSEPLLLFTYTIYILRNDFRRKLLFIS